MTQTLARSVPSSFINALLQPAYYAPLSPPFLVSFFGLFQHVVRLPSQCSKTAVRCELYVIKIRCRLGRFRDVAHPHVLIICCCGITWVRPPASEDSQSQQESIACEAAGASLSVSGVPQTLFTLCSGEILGIRIPSSCDPPHRITWM